MNHLRHFILFVFSLHTLVACGQKQEQVQPASAKVNPDAGYVDHSAFTEEEVVVSSSGFSLPGTLSIPKGDGPFPVVVLVHGSGPHDRDETIFGNKPFRDLAWGLASKGIAVLRYEKRAKVAPMSYANKIFTVKEEVTDDAIAAMQTAQANSRIDPKRSYILGHSLGATMAPRIAAEVGTLAGIIVMAGTARPFEDLLEEQGTYIAAHDSSPAVLQQKTMFDTMAARIRRLTSKDSLNPASIGGAPAAYFLDFRQEHAPARAAKLGIPTLVLQGERDYQVTKADYTLWEKALKGKSNATFKTYQKLNHLFMEGEGPSMPKEYTVPSHIPGYVINDIANWILANNH